MGRTLNKAEYISITLPSELAEIDAVGVLWLCMSHKHTFTHTQCRWFSGTTVTDDFVSSKLTAGLCCLRLSPNQVIESNLKFG